MFRDQVLRNIVRVFLQPMDVDIALIVSTRGDGRSQGVKGGIYSAG
jgi:hypothetical protein